MTPYEFVKNLDFYLSNDLKNSENKEDLEARLEKYFRWNDAGVQLKKNYDDAVELFRVLREENGEEMPEDDEIPFNTVFCEKIPVSNDDKCDKYLVRVFQCELDSDVCYYDVMEV